MSQSISEEQISAARAFNRFYTRKLGVLDQPNVPGTVHEHPNWRRRLPGVLEDIAHDKSLAVLADIMTAAGRSTRES